MIYHTLNSKGQESLKCPVTQQVNKLLTSTQTKIIIVSTNSHSISGNYLSQIYFPPSYLIS
jgi:hypothetical protein